MPHRLNRWIRFRNLTLRLALVAATPWVNACSSPLQSAMSDFHQSHYPEALTALKVAESEYRSGNASARIRYALYRGLAHLALGEAEAAHRWLAMTKTMLAAQPDALDHNEIGSLASAWQSLGHLPGARVPAYHAAP